MEEMRGKDEKQCMVYALKWTDLGIVAEATATLGTEISAEGCVPVT